MTDMQETIQKITHVTSKFPYKEFEIICKNKDEATPFLYDAIDFAVENEFEIESDYMLHIYALYLLGEFQDKQAFGKIVALASLSADVVDYLLGDVITENLKDILYNTYNGDLKLLKQAIQNPEIDDYARGAMLDVMAQLYLDHVLEKEELQSFLKELIYTEDLGDFIYTCIQGVICQCHFWEMIADISYLDSECLVDRMMYGDYADCVDMMFDYRDSQDFCKSPLSATQQLEHWAMFTEKQDNDSSQKRLETFEESMNKWSIQQTSKNAKIGRNAPCPCGSGKKYKHCCLNKPKADAIESVQEQKKWLKYYPELTSDKVDGHIYLDDFYDSESIEIDKHLYLALRHRAIPSWEKREENNVQKRKYAYLWEAFERFKKKMKTENLMSCEEYDKKFSIHYQCYEWLDELKDLLKEIGENEKYKEVTDYIAQVSSK